MIDSSQFLKDHAPKFPKEPSKSQTPPSSQAYKFALRSLGAAGASEKRLKERMKKRGFSQEDVCKAVQSLKAMGFLNDGVLAKEIVEKSAKAMEGEPLIRLRLQKAGIGEDDCVLAIKEGEEEIVGSIGLLAVSALADSGIKLISAAAFELDTDKLSPYPSRTNEFKHLPLYPLVEQDLSILVDETVKWSEIEEAIGKMVKELSFVEEYRGKQIPAGKKSIMLSYKIGNDDSTMNSKQIEKKMNAIVGVLKKKVGAELR